jgi:hypothetical protein
VPAGFTNPIKPLLPAVPAGAPDAAELASQLRAEAESDREFMEKSTRAFVSFVRGYKEHHCKFVFRLQVRHVTVCYVCMSVNKIVVTCLLLWLTFTDVSTSVGCG